MNDDDFQMLLDQAKSISPRELARFTDGMIATHRSSLEVEQQVDLLYLEYLARRSDGDPDVVNNLRKRFPELEAEFLRQVQVDTDLSRWEDTTDFSAAIEASESNHSKNVRHIGDYTVLEKIGEGSQALVFRVVHPMLRCELALKVSKQREDLAERVLKEGRMLVNVNDPGIARVVDAGIWDGHPFIVSELIRGVTLQKRVEQNSVTRRQLVEFVSSLARTVAKLHKSGIVHCDIKPGNVLFDASEQPKLVDFGMAVDRSTAAWDPTATIHGDHRGGTLAYMAPELLSNAMQPPDSSNQAGSTRNPGGDIFSLGGLLYFALVGRHPYASVDPSTVVGSVAEGKWDRQALRDSKAPASLQRVCEKAMAANPDARHKSATDFAKDLDAWLTRSQPLTGGKFFMIAAALVAMVGMGWFAWNRTQSVAESIARFGNLDVKVWAEDRTFELVDRVPVRSGERVQISAPLRAKHHGELWLVSSEGNSSRLSTFEAADESRWVHYPAELDDAVPLVGPGGTEAILWIESREPLTHQSMGKAIGAPEIWPPISESTVFRIIDGKLTIEQESRSFGEPETMESSDSVVQKYLRLVTERLQRQDKHVEIVTFSHFE